MIFDKAPAKSLLIAVFGATTAIVPAMAQSAPQPGPPAGPPDLSVRESATGLMFSSLKAGGSIVQGSVNGGTPQTIIKFVGGAQCRLTGYDTIVDGQKSAPVGIEAVASDIAMYKADVTAGKNLKGPDAAKVFADAQAVVNATQNCTVPGAAPAPIDRVNPPAPPVIPHVTRRSNDSSLSLIAPVPGAQVTYRQDATTGEAIQTSLSVPSKGATYVLAGGSVSVINYNNGNPQHETGAAAQAFLKPMLALQDAMKLQLADKTSETTSPAVENAVKKVLDVAPAVKSAPAPARALASPKA